jgi:hypothetical protein
MPNHPRAARPRSATQAANRALSSMMAMMGVAAMVVSVPMLGTDDLNHIRASGAFLVAVVRLPF